MDPLFNGKEGALFSWCITGKIKHVNAYVIIHVRVLTPVDQSIDNDRVQVIYPHAGWHNHKRKNAETLTQCYTNYNTKLHRKEQFDFQQRRVVLKANDVHGKWPPTV